jgi:alpha-glucoside transport system permease protein
MDPRLLTAIIVVVGVPGVLVGYILLAEVVLRAVPDRIQPRVRPWAWLLPALLFLGVFLIWPTLITIIRSFYNKAGSDFVGLANYQWFFGSPDALTSLRNNVIWVVVLTGITVGLGLIIAVLVDRVRYEALAKAVIFVPLAISATASGAIWKFMFAYQPPGQPQTGTLNAVIGAVGAGPLAWLQTSTLAFNTILLIIVFAWAWTGFAMVIISAAYKGISRELLEAARVDGATEWNVFRRIILPLLVPTLAVISTTMIITALKAFDIVYVMTGGQYDTGVIAYTMYREMFTDTNFGRASAVAVILLLAIVPVMAINVRRFRSQEVAR